MKRIAFFSVVTFSLLLACELFAQGIPETINYQGVLKDASGNVVPDGNYNMTFRLYDLGSTVVWMESKVVSIVEGIINTQLGSIVPMSYSIFNGPLWLGITIESGSELSPRIALTSVPYSFMAMNVSDGKVVKSLNSLKDDVNLVAGSNITITPGGNNLTISATGGGGGTVTQVNTGAGLTGGPITTTGTISVANEGITNTMLQNNSVTSSKIVDATITASDIGSSQVVKSLNSIKDNVNLVAGSNITITPSGQNITIASTSGGIGGSGTVNTIPLFTGATTLGNSFITQSSTGITITNSLSSNINPILSLTRTGTNSAISIRFTNSSGNHYNLGMRSDGRFGISSLNNNVGMSDVLVINNNNIGIGNTNPTDKLVVDGTISISGVNTSELNRTQTGNANLVPIAYANVSADGTINISGTTSNVTLQSHSAGSGNYYFNITGENIIYTDYVCIATLRGGVGGEISWSSSGGTLYIGTANSAGTTTDKPFTFVVYKK